MEKVIDTIPIYGPEKPDGSKDLWGVDVIVAITHASGVGKVHQTFIGSTPFESGSEAWHNFVEDAVRKAPDQAYKENAVVRKR
ncbi:hypothetical protein [Ponticaulis sp.]|uniref:hypothetical protein n=1 Tax=Ponticaulis sp. TaxID=2020902 RepID=UPI000B66A2A2|nr:hypothetical protein [Ponticaulis sp.]MAJ07609.1 hypothetical protein [Ponticaulis sp.]RPG17837.1 MAG: hypothetical protein CBC85_004645 [Hyphomonadaceae bacterium TMED125]HBH90859.1 hypothetical protein [Hyphomonadaceae bacterium]HBJ92711.1 hypothetical protein [Hyphomonadaceae bacterium]